MNKWWRSSWFRSAALGFVGMLTALFLVAFLYASYTLWVDHGVLRNVVRFINEVQQAQRQAQAPK